VRRQSVVKSASTVWIVVTRLVQETLVHLVVRCPEFHVRLDASKAVLPPQLKASKDWVHLHILEPTIPSLGALEWNGVAKVVCIILIPTLGAAPLAPLLRRSVCKA